jgi:hypothetical protein
MVDRGFLLYLSPIVSSFTLLLFRAKCETLRTWSPRDLETCGPADVVYVVGAGPADGGRV